MRHLADVHGPGTEHVCSICFAADGRLASGGSEGALFCLALKDRSCAAWKLSMEVKELGVFAFLEMAALRLGAETGALSCSMLKDRSCAAWKMSMEETKFGTFSFLQMAALRWGA